jgi:hypothetical protein
VWQYLIKAAYCVLAVLPLLLGITRYTHQPSATFSPPLNALALVKAQQNYLQRGMTAWQQAEYAQAEVQFELAAQHGASEALTYLRYIRPLREQAHTTSVIASSFSNWAATTCLQQIVFVTAELSSLVQAQRFNQQFANDQRLASLPLCIAPQVLFVPNLLNCNESAAQSRITCDIAPLAPVLKDAQFSHLVIFTQQGKAFVQNGIMYLDQHDTYDVLVHELAHFAGFVDEYPLSAELAERVCSSGEAPNMVFQYANKKEVDWRYWQHLGQPQTTALNPARTCDNHTSQAFKLSHELTFMEYHDVRTIPGNYLVAWQNALRHPLYLTPAYLNFAQVLEQQNSPQAAYWRGRFAEYRQQNSP